MSRMHHNRIQLIAALAVLVVWILAAPAAAAQQEQAVMKKPAQELQEAALPVAKVTIREKSIETVTTNIGDKYNVVSDTMIVNTDGHQVSIRKMLVPCDAKVTYRTEKGMRVAERIEIKRVAAGASWHWTSAKPE